MLLHFTQLPPLGLYIHIPWCVRKCPYCDFNSHEIKTVIDQRAYISCLIDDLEQALPEVWGRQCSSIFIGGGTPSVISPERYDELLSALRARLNLTSNCEITLEANPGAVERGRFAEYLDCGINRISMGVQSFNDDMLKALGRIHNVTDVERAVGELHAANLDNFNIDLMFGLPGQDQTLAKTDLQMALDCKPAHISYYQLTLEPNTLFYRQPPKLPHEESVWQIQSFARGFLEQHGFFQYEVSAWAQAGKACQHNMNYWLFGDYLGIGAGAHSKITNAHEQNVVRSVRVKHPFTYMEKVALGQHIQTRTNLSAQDLRLEFMMNALRLNGGFEKSLFDLHAGQSLRVLESVLREAEDRGLLERSLTHIQPSARGRQYLNDLLQLFMG